MTQPPYGSSLLLFYPVRHLTRKRSAISLLTISLPSRRISASPLIPLQQGLIPLDGAARRIITTDLAVDQCLPYLTYPVEDGVVGLE